MRILPTPEETDEELSLTPENEIIEQLDANYAQTRGMIAHLLEFQDQLDPELFSVSIREEIADHTEAMAQILGEDIEDVGEQIEWIEVEVEDAPSIDLAIQKLVDEDYSSAEEGITSMAECLGVDIPTAVAYYNGDAMPSVGEVQELVNCFPSLQSDPEAASHLVQLVGSGAGEFSQVIGQMRAEFNSFQQERAEFAQQQHVQNGLRELERRAQALFNANCITPVEFRLLVPQGIPAEDKADFAAYFSDFASSQGMTAQEWLKCANFTLGILEQRGELPIALLSNFSAPTEYQPFDSQETQYLKAYRARNGVG